jgi:hypothetical protein
MADTYPEYSEFEFSFISKLDITWTAFELWTLQLAGDSRDENSERKRA